MGKFKLSLHSFNTIDVVYYKDADYSSQPNIFVLIILGVLIGFVNGFWGGGGGMICVPTLTIILGLASKNAHATAIFIMLPLSIASFIVYLIMGFSFTFNIVYIGAGFILGGLVGAILLKKINNLVLKFVFGLIIIASAIKIIV